MMDTVPLVTFVVGATLGVLCTYVLARARAGERLAALEAVRRLETERRVELEHRVAELSLAVAQSDKSLAVSEERVRKAGELIAEQQRFVGAARGELESSFKALAATALAGNNEQFLALAEQRLATVRAQTEADLEDKKRGIEQLLSPLHETLGKLEQRTADIEQARVAAYSKLEQHVGMLGQQAAQLGERTTVLATALRGSSQARGHWGEMVLRSVAETAGMVEHCDFEVQAVQDDGKRPDMVVKLPGGRLIAIDAKVPLSAYYEVAEAKTDAAQGEALDRHVSAIKKHVLALRARDYAATLASDIDIVVLFLPGDAMLSAAYNRDPDLQVEAMRHKVLIVTPTTLVGLLRAVSVTWRERAVAENAQAVADTARELYDRAAKFGEELAKVGRGLKTAVSAYNDAMGSFESRLVPMGKKLLDMKVNADPKRQLEAQPPIDEVPRQSRLVDSETPPGIELS
jgi:DNA recombination protein RmuC